MQGVGEAVGGLGAAEDADDVPIVLHLEGGDQAVARLGGTAGLQTLGIGAIIFRFR